jgi:hypothetical protein
MAKYIGRSTIIEHKGLARLKTFCANNVPFLVCRDETITDVGIDGEIEVCLQNSDGKVEATGDRIKFQLKSTESGDSYIQDETDIDFKFYANRNDVDYWSKHKQDVLLIIYDVKKDALYGKKITINDFKSQLQTKIKWHILFNKRDCELSENNFDFHKKYTVAIKHRLNYDIHEPAMSNLFKIKKFPRLIYTYKTEYKKKEDVYKSLPESTNLPEFVIYNQILYTFVEPKKQSEYFTTKIIDSSSEKIIYYNLIQAKSIRNHFVELIRIYFKDFLRTRGIFLNKEHNRYYFGIHEGEAIRSILTKTRKKGRTSSKIVVKFYSYGKFQFFRHNAFEIDFIHAGNMYISITPTYFITVDGRNPADGKLASSFIIRQKSREFNPTVANNIHTIFSYLSNENDDIIVRNNDNIELEISSYIRLKLPFSIPIDDKGFPRYLKKQKKQMINTSMQSLFNE